MGEPNRIEGMMDVVERDLEVSQQRASFSKSVAVVFLEGNRVEGVAESMVGVVERAL